MPQTIDNMIATWNNGATTFTAIKMNVTNTASAAASSLIELQLGSKGVFRVTKGGALMINSDLTSALGVGALYLFKHPSSSNDVYLQNNGETELRFGIQGQQKYAFGVGGQTIRADTALFWSASPSDVGGVADLALTRRGPSNLRLGGFDAAATTSTVTITIAAPGVVTWSSHGFSTGTPVVFTTTGALPTGITAGTTYYAVVVDANTFQIASSVANAIATPATVITTSGTQSGTHTGTRYNTTQRLGMQSVTGVTDRLGADLVIQGSQGTGTGAGGSIIFQVAPAGSSGTAQNALATALTIASDKNASFAGRVGSEFGYVYGSPQFYAPAIASNTGFQIVNNSCVALYGNGTALFAANSSGSSGLTIASTTSLGWTETGSSITSNPDVKLWRDAANILALRNGGTSGTPVPQNFMIYNYFDGTNGERGQLGWFSNEFFIATNALGNGTGARAISFSQNNTTVWKINDNGNFLAGADNAYDIGASAGQRPRNVFVAGYIRAAGANGFWAGSTSFIFWDARTQMSAPASNVLRVDDPSSNAAIIQTRQFTVSNLPSAATYPGSMAFVSDATATTARSTVAGGGSNKVMVMSDGTNWLIVA